MSDRTYGLTEIVGTSTEGIDAAIKNLIPRIEAEWKKQKGLKP